MREQNLFDKIDLHLIRVLHTVLIERSVSKAAIRLGMHQPAVSAALKRLRDLSGDPLLVRSGVSMLPTDTALRMVDPAANILRSAEALFSDARGFDPRTATRTFRVMANDYLDPLFLPRLVARIKAQAPLCPIEVLPLSADVHYQAHLAQGDVDLVIANWPKPPDELHLGRLFSDEVVCMVSNDHPVVRRGWDRDGWLSAEHIAPTPTYPGAKGVIDLQLDELGLTRNVAARCAHFSLIPDIVATSLLVLTTGRQFCQRFESRLPVTILPCPVAFQPLHYYQLWHSRSHHSAAAIWLRNTVREVVLSLRRS
ncbi:LysR family transcriptional regulator [Diaphorobacter caeni]|uniref:LysR family transcriptional regulator n=1 Tax=Diaphorobacter caeni TaxID=2784387 RepID=UPI00189082A2|nr:LysR family transcriptional regulator [Diaphorobacter caeni]MBF5003402.1 LysR family transcriptional regulator [Diaphorobacter caeni]